MFRHMHAFVEKVREDAPALIILLSTVFSVWRKESLSERLSEDVFEGIIIETDEVNQNSNLRTKMLNRIICKTEKL